MELLLWWVYLNSTYTFNRVMINDDGLNDGIVSSSFGEWQKQFIVRNRLGQLSALIIHSILFYFNLNVLFMSGKLSSWLFNNIKVLKNNRVTDLDIKHSLTWLLEIHLGVSKRKYLSKLQNDSVSSFSHWQFINHLFIRMSFVHVDFLVKRESFLVGKNT